jgi:flagellar motor switch protein FliM
VMPWRGTGLLIMDAKLVFKLVDQFFGGDGRHAKIEGRDFTPTENRLVYKTVNQLFEDLRHAWLPIHTLKFEQIGHELNPAMANVVGPNEVVIVSSFQVDLEGGNGDFHVTIPYSMIEPIRDQLMSVYHSAESERDDRWMSSLRRDILHASLPIDLIVTERDMTLRDVMEFEVGDVIPVDIPDQLKLKANAVPLYTCQLGTSRGNLAVKIHRILKQDSE